MKKVAIIILVYNGRQYLPELFRSLINNQLNQYYLKIIAVDNASTDDSISFIEKNYPAVFIIRNQKNLGFAAGNNNGIKYALENNFDYLVLLNQDIIVNQDWLQPLIETLEKETHLGAVQPKIMCWPAKEKINSLGNVLHYLGFGFTSFNGLTEAQVEKYPVYINYASGAAVVYRSEVLKKIGLFDESFFMYHEDTDLTLRIKFFGYQIKLVPQSKVFHQYQFSKSIKKFYYIERNRFNLLLKFYKLPTLLLILPALIFLELGLIVQSIANGFIWQRFKVYGYFLNPFNLYKIFKSREKIQKQRKISDRQIIKELSGKIEFQEIDNFFLKYIFNPLLNIYKKIIEQVIFW